MHETPIATQQNVYAVYDSKAEAYLPPFLARTDQVAMRMVAAAAIDPTKDMHRFSGDYTLFGIAIYHEQHGELVMHDAHNNLGTALALAARYQETE